MAFYDAIMETIGVKRVWTHEKGLGYGRNENEEKLNLFVHPNSEDISTGAGFHLAFEAPNREAVHRFHAGASQILEKPHSPSFMTQNSFAISW